MLATGREDPPRDLGGQSLRTARRLPDQRRRHHRVRHGDLRPALRRTSPTSVAQQLVSTAQRADGPHVQVAVAGQVAEAADRQSFGGAGLGILLAGVVLLLVFGSVFAMALPLLSALASLGTAIAVIGMLSHLLEDAGILDRAGAADRPRRRASTTPCSSSPATGRGSSPARTSESIVDRGRHLGPRGPLRRDHRLHRPARDVRARGLLPLRAGDRRVDRGAVHHDRRAHPPSRPPRVHRSEGALPPAEAEPGGERPAGRRRRHQGVLAAVGRVHRARARSFRPSLRSAIIVLVALPFFSLRLGSSDQGNDPVGTTTRQAYDMLAAGFGPGFNGPLLLVASADGQANTAGTRRAVGRGRPPAERRARDASGVDAPEGRQTGVADHRLPEVGTAGRGDHRPDRAPAHRHHPGRRAGIRGERRRRREHRDLRRLRQRADLEAAALHRPGGRAVVPAPRDRLPQPPDPA